MMKSAYHEQINLIGKSFECISNESHIFCAHDECYFCLVDANAGWPYFVFRCALNVNCSVTMQCNANGIWRTCHCLHPLHYIGFIIVGALFSDGWRFYWQRNCRPGGEVMGEAGRMKGEYGDKLTTKVYHINIRSAYQVQARWIEFVTCLAFGTRFQVYAFNENSTAIQSICFVWRPLFFFFFDMSIALHSTSTVYCWRMLPLYQTHFHQMSLHLSFCHTAFLECWLPIGCTKLSNARPGDAIEFRHLRVQSTQWIRFKTRIYATKRSSIGSICWKHGKFPTFFSTSDSFERQKINIYFSHLHGTNVIWMAHIRQIE